ncbi:hypothetical protein [Kineosporia sp. A_224]|uniref:hypothetical protein n=1 Tax=Kineosporia sp. A_224 TaxID=1962180 RepID=UPI000B4BFB03|nr:hypothetical protein [Kineosporia sp. A_224]
MLWAEAAAGSPDAMLRLAAASVADDDEHGASALVLRACASAHWSASVLDQGVALLARAGWWRAVVDVAGDRWDRAEHGPHAGTGLMAALLQLREIDRAEQVLHELAMLAASDLELGAAWQSELRRQEFELDGLRVTRDVALSFTVKLDRFVDSVLPTPLWRPQHLELPLADGPRIGVVPWAFEEDRPENRDIARGLALWVSANLRVGTDADATCHVLSNLRGPVADLHVRHTHDLMLDLTGLAGQPAFLVGGAVLGRGSSLTLDVDVWRPEGRHVRFQQHLGDRPGAGFAAVLRRLASVCGADPRPDAPPPSSARVVARLVPAYSDALPVVLAGIGSLRPELVDRRRDRLDRMLDLVGDFPDEPEPRMLLLGLLQRMEAAGSPIPREYLLRVAALPALPYRVPLLEQLVRPQEDQ